MGATRACLRPHRQRLHTRLAAQLDCPLQRLHALPVPVLPVTALCERPAVVAVHNHGDMAGYCRPGAVGFAFPAASRFQAKLLLGGVPAAGGCREPRELPLEALPEPHV